MEKTPQGPDAPKPAKATESEPQSGSTTPESAAPGSSKPPRSRRSRRKSAPADKAPTTSEAGDANSAPAAADAPSPGDAKPSAEPTKGDAKPGSSESESPKPEPSKSEPSKSEPSKPDAATPSDAPETASSDLSAGGQNGDRPPVEPVVVKAGGGGAIWVALIALLVAIGAGVFAGWQWQQDLALRETNAVLASQLKTLERDILQQHNALQQQRSDLEQKIQRSDGRHQEHSSAVAQLKSAQDEVKREIASEREKAQQRKPRDWMIAEADYLVRMASRKLWLEQDPATAEALLKDADSRLAMLGEAELTPIRKALASDLALLAKQPRNDRAGMALAMEALVQQIDSLPLNNVTLPELAAEPDSVEVSDDVSEWRANLSKSWRALTDDFITVSRRQGPVEPLLAPEQAWYLREHLKGKLLQAQLSLYHGDKPAMDQALATAQGWIRDYFDLSSAQVEGALNQLDSWRATDIAPLQPIRFSSSAPLEALVAERLGRTGGAG
ncbi:uroporphyrinogen-III C-methyltransferase [Ferrimonas marina]|uniref:HemX protein n=1 Tax=Ferrimonas marina TaxID=299255 RepID=A0A1M5XRS8_9GAMM|nr:uroporphyrinogen-III C-methyltransferase [Ferrimonas marina]SHI01973.1 HemX protein [Ferrimonas marina]